MLDGQLLEAFLAVAHHRHFVRAADSLGIVQSVVSKRLARLEQLLGMQLIDRSSRSNIRLTRAGALFLDEAERALEALRQAERIGRNLARGETGPLRLGYVFSASMTGTLTRLLAALHHALPSIEIELTLTDTPAQLRALESGKLDIGLVRPRPSYPAGTLATTVHREGLVLGVSADSELASRHRLGPADLAGQTFIVPQFHEDVGLIDTIRDLAAKAGLPMPAIRRAGDFISAASLAAVGVGIVLAPASLRNLALNGLVIHEIAAYDAIVDLVCVVRGDAPAAAARIAAQLTERAGA